MALFILLNYAISLCGCLVIGLVWWQQLRGKVGRLGTAGLWDHPGYGLGCFKRREHGNMGEMEGRHS